MEEEFSLVSSNRTRNKSSTSSSETDGSFRGRALVHHADFTTGIETEFRLPKFREESFKVMFQLRNNHNFTDVQLLVGTQVLHAHKLVLAAASNYFKAMFTSGLQESEMGTVRLQGVSTTVMHYIIRFMYSGNISITEKLVCPLLSAASMFQVRGVVTACCKFLEDQMEAANVIGIANFALQNGCSELHAKATAFLEENFSEVSQAEEFLELGGGQLVSLIKKDELNVPDEEAVYNAVLRWVEYCPHERQDKMHNILKFIRCHYLPPRFLSDQMSNCKIVRSLPACKEYLAKIFEDLSLHKPPGRVARSCPNTACLFHFVGGYSDRRSLNSLHCYHLQKDTWTELGSMEIARSGLGAVFLRGSLFTVGGRTIHKDGTVQDTNALGQYIHSKGYWSKRNRLQQCRNRLGVAVLDNLLYAVGGVDGSTMLNSVERFDPDTDSWRYVSPLRTARGGLCCAVLHRLLYTIGGSDGLSRLASVECYNPDRDVWTEVAPLLQARSGAAVSVVCNRLYIVGGYDGSEQINTVEMYDPEANSWTFVSPMRVRRSALAVATANCRIYAMGGFDGQALLSSVEIYNVEKDEWTDGPSLPWGRSGHAIAVPSCMLPVQGREGSATTGSAAGTG